MFFEIRLGSAGLHQPAARRLRIVQRFLRAQGFGADDEHGAARVEALQGCGQVIGVDIGHEMDIAVRYPIRPQCLDDHPWPQVGSADANVDDIGNPLAAAASV